MTSRCRSQYNPPRDPLYVPVFTPLACPDPVNLDPRRNQAYCKPTHVLSQPLSHQEYLRKLVANNGRAISTGALVQNGSGQYTRTDWMATSGSCVLANVPVPAAQPFPGAGLTELKNSYNAARGTIGKFDLTNRTAEITTLKRAGLAVSSSAGCTTCNISGTEIKATNCDLCK